MKVLLVEDDPVLGKNIHQYLQSETYVCEVADSFQAAEEKAALYSYDIALLDLTLPGGDGLDLVKKIRLATPETGIIIISARNAVNDRVTGLELGADDYLSKPFHLPELNARIKALARRRLYKGESQLTFAEIRIFPERRKVMVHDTPISLRKKEYELLLFFVVNRGKVLSKVAIAEHLWGDYMDEADSYDFLYNHVKNLRKKMKKAGALDYIQTIYGLGYKFSRP